MDKKAIAQMCRSWQPSHISNKTADTQTQKPSHISRETEDAQWKTQKPSHISNKTADTQWEQHTSQATSGNATADAQWEREQEFWKSEDTEAKPRSNESADAQWEREQEVRQSKASIQQQQTHGLTQKPSHISDETTDAQREREQSSGGDRTQKPSHISNESADAQWEREQEFWRSKAAIQQQTHDRMMKNMYPTRLDKAEKAEELKWEMDQQMHAKQMLRFQEEAREAQWVQPPEACPYGTRKSQSALSSHRVSSEDVDVHRASLAHEAAEYNMRLTAQKAVEQQLARMNEVNGDIKQQRDEVGLTPHAQTAASNAGHNKTRPSDEDIAPQPPIWAWTHELPPNGGAAPNALKPSQAPPPWARDADAAPPPPHTSKRYPQHQGQGTEQSKAGEASYPWATVADFSATQPGRSQPTQRFGSRPQPKQAPPYAVDQDRLQPKQASPYGVDQNRPQHKQAPPYGVDQDQDLDPRGDQYKQHSRRWGLEQLQLSAQYPVAASMNDHAPFNGLW
eukprot:gene30294-35282_t